MRFPKKYIKQGKFKLHSGGDSKVLYDVNSLLTDYALGDNLICAIPYIYGTYVGIATGGAILAALASEEQDTPQNWAMIKDNEVKGKIKKRYMLLDDVVTTEKSIREAIKIIGHEPEEIWVAVDRRKVKKLKINSVYDITEK